MELAIDRQQHEDGITGCASDGSSPLRPTGQPSPGVGPAAEVDTRALARLEDVREVLERARTLLDRGWLQNGWYTTPPRLGRTRHPGRRPLRGRWRLLADRTPDPTEITRACLVAAVTVAAHRPGARVDVIGDAGPALDVTWEALEESRGRPGAGGRAVPREAGVARLRELVRWNDSPGRTREEVLALVDRAISRTIMSAVGRPAAG